MSFKLPLLKSRGNAKIAVHAVPNVGSFKWEEKLMRNVCAKRQTNQRETDLFMKEIRILNGILRNIYPTFCYDTVGMENGLKPVFHFNRIVAKRSVFHCFMNTQAELMIWAQ